MKVGILGGGQLGLMLAEALERLGTQVRVIDSDSASPCALRIAGTTQGRLEDPQALAPFFAQCDRVTYDSENIPAAPLTPFAEKLRPSLLVLSLTQDRGREKSFLDKEGFTPVPFREVSPGADLHAAIRAFGLPCIVKSVLGGYDGKGQHRVTTEKDLASLPRTAESAVVLEEVVALKAELSCIVARDAAGTAVTFPIFENVHRQHVLESTVLPSSVPAMWQQEATARARAIAQLLKVEGLITVEFFVGTGRDGVERLYVNELAPRTHNSGHVTRKACSLSQFDALARVLSGIPLVQPETFAGGWCMGQLLGDVWLAQGKTGGALDLSVWKQFPQVVEVYEYGKREARPGRKMGHFIVHASSAAEALTISRAFRERLSQT